MANKEKLHDMVNAIINDENEKAEIDFHSYLEDKMKEEILGQDSEGDEEIETDTKDK